MGIPCIYYGMEQSFSGPEATERKWLPGWGGNDRYLREAMFGPKNPRKNCFDTVQTQNCTDQLCKGCSDDKMPGFGPFGTSGAHCFDEKSPTYVRMAELGRVRKELMALRRGRQYLRPISFLSNGFDFHGPGEIMPWSRIFHTKETLCVVNQHGTQNRGARIMVDAGLNPEGSKFTIRANTEEAAAKASGQSYNKQQYAVGKSLPVQRAGDGTAYIEILDLPPAEVIVLENEG